MKLILKRLDPLQIDIPKGISKPDEIICYQYVLTERLLANLSGEIAINVINFKLKSARFKFRQKQGKSSTSQADIKIRVDELLEKKGNRYDRQAEVRKVRIQKQRKCSASSAEIKIRIDELPQK